MAARQVGTFHGMPIQGQTREIVYNVAQHLRNMRTELNLAEETSQGTCVGQTVVEQILKGVTSLALRGEIKFSTPMGKKNKRMKRIHMDEFTKASIRRKIHSMYIAREVFPTLSNIRNALEEDNIVKCSKSHLRKVLIDLGLKWKTFRSQWKILIERPDVVIIGELII